MIVLIGDVGTPDGRYHLGDEAMLESALLELRARGHHEVTVISADPASTSERYEVPSVGRIGFAGLTHVESEKRLDAVVDAARGALGRIDWQDGAWAVIETVAASTGVIVTGGGNLSLLWPEHVYERVAIARIAAAVGRPFALTGQMLGPFLDERMGQLVSELLESATAVGVRDHYSLEIARRLIGERPVSVLGDDALMLGDERPGTEAALVTATFAPYLAGIPLDSFVEGAAETLEHMRQLTGADVRFLPHAGTLGRLDDEDSAIHARVAERLGHGTLEPLIEASAAAALHRSATFTLSTRYHPIVFASLSGRPMIGAPADDYTASKIKGALAMVGAHQALVPAGALGGTASAAAVSTLWAARDRLADAAAARRPVLIDAHRRWWDALVDSLSAGSFASPAVVVPAAAELTLVDDHTRAELSRMESVLLHAGSRATLNYIETAARELEAARLRSELESAERTSAELRDELARARQNVSEIEGALAESHRLLSELADPAVQRSLSRNVDRYIPPSTVEALLETRTFRWSRSVRAVWARVRRWAGRT